MTGNAAELRVIEQLDRRSTDRCPGSRRDSQKGGLPLLWHRREQVREEIGTKAHAAGRRVLIREEVADKLESVLGRTFHGTQMDRGGKPTRRGKE